MGNRLTRRVLTEAIAKVWSLLIMIQWYHTLLSKRETALFVESSKSSGTMIIEGFASEPFSRRNAIIA